VLGTPEQQKKFRRKIPDAKCKLIDVEIYTPEKNFFEWWRSFKDAIQSSGLVGFTEQIELCFRLYMDPQIRKFFKDINLKNKFTLEQMVRIVLCNYSKKLITKWHYQDQLNVIQKESDETVGSYYLRFCNLAKLAKNKDDEHLRELFMKGLQPLSLFKEVNGKLNEDSTFSDAHKWAVHFEKKYFEVLEHQDHVSQIRSPKTKQTDSANRQKAPQGKNVPKNNTNSNTIHKSRNHDKNTSINRSSQGPKQFSKCGFCGNQHDFKECQSKHPFYRPSEIKILKLLDRKPIARTNWPKDDQFITRETDWVKKLLEKKNEADNKSATISSIQPNENTSKSYNRRNRKKQNQSNKSPDNSKVDAVVDPNQTK
jgi:hypothetical protein